MERAIILATDLESDLGPGLDLGARFALERGATLIVLHVVPLRIEDGEAMIVVAADHSLRGARRDLAARVPPDLGVPCRQRVEVGSPQEVIARVVAEERAELVLVETRPRGWLRRLLAPNLAVTLSATLPCAVVTYRHGQAARPASDGSSHATEVPKAGEALRMLECLLEARVHAVVDLLDRSKASVRALAARPSVKHSVEALQRQRGDDPFARQTAALLELELREHQLALGAVGIALLAETGPIFERGLRAAPTGRRAVVTRCCEEGAYASLPIESEEPDGPLVIEVGARLDLAGLPPAALLVTWDAGRDFLRILAQPGPTASTETYAFDEQGTMLSNSRFPDQLRRMGLLPREPGAQTARRLRVGAPGERETDQVDAAPLTRMAADATQGHDGTDLRGYPDYRGVPVIGAWRWIEAYDFGVAAEMDQPPATP